MIEKILQQKAKVVNEAIPRFLPITPPNEMYKAMHYILDIERFRSSALLLATEAVGGKPENVLPAAVAIELIQSFISIHDDIIDGANFRKGLTTVHTKWGVSKAIVAGDALYSKAFEILSCTKSEPSQIAESIELISKTYTGICEGKWMDLNFESRKDIKEEEYMIMVEKKTALLASALKIGAILSSTNRDNVRALWNFGCKIGVGLQIYDEVIDLILPENILGKTQGEDIIEGKRTLIVIHALSKGIDIDILGKSNATQSEIISTLKNAGSIDYAKNKALNLMEEGKTMLNVLPDSDAKKVLIMLTDYMTTRNIYPESCLRELRLTTDN